MNQGSGTAARMGVSALALGIVLVGAGMQPASAAPVTVDIQVDQPSSEQITAVWGAYEVPADAEQVVVTLPPGLEKFDLANGANTLFVSDAGGTGGPLQSGLSTTATEIVVDLPLLREIFGASATHLRLEMWAADDEGQWGEWDSVEFELDLVLTDDPDAAASFALSYDEAEEEHRGLSYTVAEPLAVRGGDPVTVRAEPGFWDDPAIMDVYGTELWGVDSEPDGRFGFPVEVSEDGSAVTATIEGDPQREHLLVLQATQGDEVAYRTVYLFLESAVSQYVTSVYQDLFGRAPDATGLEGWSQALENGTPYGAVADGITYSDEFRLGLIADSYQQFLGRAPDTAGLYAWLAAMQQGMPIQQMETGFIASDEYYSRAGGSDAEWVAAMYEDILGRTPSDAEVDGWVGVVRKNGRIDVARGFLYSTEYLTHVVDGYYEWLLDRSIDPTGARDWVAAIQQGVRSEAIIAGIIASDEYRYRVGRVLN